MKIKDKLNPNPYRKPDKIASTSERIQYLLTERGMKQSDLARSTGISRGAISNYAIGRYEPKSDIVQKLAEALDCSEMWLWGYDVPMNRESITYVDEENPYQLDVIDTMGALDVEHQRMLRDQIVAYAKNATGGKFLFSEPALIDGHPKKNIVKIAGRDGSFRELRLTDDQMKALNAFIDLLPEAPDEI